MFHIVKIHAHAGDERIGDLEALGIDAAEGGASIGFRR
jgi:hypothetical protein